MAKIMGQEYPSIAVVMVSGEPYEMGLQHGRKLAHMIRDRLTASSSGMHLSTCLPEETLNALFDKHKNLVNEIRPKVLEEMRGVADGAGVDFESLLACFLSRELPYGFSDLGKQQASGSDECTAWAAVGRATVGGESILAQNRDSAYDSGRYRIVIVAKPSDGNSYVATGSVGSNDGLGINIQGLAIASPAVRVLDSITACTNGKPPGIQSFTLARMVLETCKTVTEGIDLIKATPSGYMGLNWILADAWGGIARVERSYTASNVTYEDKESFPTETIGATNHYSSDDMKDLATLSSSPSFTLAPSLGSSSKKRYARISTLLSSMEGRLCFDVFKSFARDHANGAGVLSICNHSESYGTNLSMIAQCKHSRLWVLRGSPCLNEYVPYDCPGSSLLSPRG